jgi:pimeloyl-ACP methyl ester carboxylesterase
VIVGGTPLAPEEVGRLVGVNALGYAAAERGWDDLNELLAGVRERLLGDEGLAGVLSDAPPEDRAIMQDPAWRHMARTNVGEALRQGSEGWADESMALHRDWDFDLGAIRATVTWWHGDHDMNAPLSAARRAAAKLRQVDLRVWKDEGHFASVVHEAEIVRELLSRSA